LLLGPEGSVDWDVVKLCDFGSCVILSSKMPRSMDNSGTLSYTSPEMYLKKGAAVAADMWSLGVVLYVLIAGSNPFQGAFKSNREEIIRRICSGSFEQRREHWLNASPPGRDLVQQLLTVQESLRLSCGQALRHPWLATSERPMLSSGLANAPGVQLEASRFLPLLRVYAQLSEAQRLALLGCALAASEEDLRRSGMAGCNSLFLALDSDRDGRVRPGELAEGLRRLLSIPPSAEAASVATEGAAQDALSSQRRLKETDDLELWESFLDLDGSGAIEWLEFAAVALIGLPGLSEESEPATAAFRLLNRSISTKDSPCEEPSKTIMSWVAARADKPPELSSSEFSLRCLHWALRSMQDFAAKCGVVPSNQQPSTHTGCPAGDSPLPLTLCAAGDDFLFVAVDHAGDPIVRDWNTACQAQGRTDMVLKLDDCILKVNGISANTKDMVNAFSRAVSRRNFESLIRFSSRRFEVVLNKAKGTPLGVRIKD